MILLLSYTAFIFSRNKSFMCVSFISFPYAVLCLVTQTCPTFLQTPWPVACQAPLFTGILQARILEWVAMPFSRGYCQPSDQTQVSCVVGRFFTSWATKGAPVFYIFIVNSTPKFSLHNSPLKMFRCIGSSVNHLADTVPPWGILWDGLTPQPGTQLPPQGSLTRTLEILLPPLLDRLIAVHLPFTWFTSSFSQRPSFGTIFLRKGPWEVSFFNALHDWIDWIVFMVFLSRLKCQIPVLEVIFL